MAFFVLAASPAQADQARRDEWWLRTLHVTNAWETTRGSGVTIAVLDTGVDPAQPDLAGSVTTGPDYTNSGRTAGGQYWGIHGTEIASLIAGHGHGAGQDDGILGIAPSAKILSVRVTLESNDPQFGNQAIAGALPDGIARGISWAVRHDATVIDLPLDPVITAGAAGSGGSAAEKAAVEYALDKNVVLVAPAGDGGGSTNAVNYPAAYHGVIAVGAFDQQFTKASFTSRQPYVTVTAAGAGVTAANPPSLFANDPSLAYTQLNSTSAASAMAAGVAALIRAQFPNLNPAQVTRALTTSTVFRPHGGRNDGSGFGTVDAAKALIAAAGIAEAVPKTAASGTAQSPPSPPVAHSSPIHRNISRKLAKDAAIAGAVFLLLLGSIFAFRAWRRRHARSARLAEVRAATQVAARKPAPAKKGTPKKGTAKKSAGKKTAPAGPRLPAAIGSQAPDNEAAPELQAAGFIPAPLSPAIPGSGSPTFAGAASTGFTGSASPAFPGSASPSFPGAAPTGFTGSASPSFPGAAPTGFTGSSGLAGSSAPGFTGSSGVAGSASGLAGSSAPGFTGSSGFSGSASGLAGSSSSGFAAAPTPPLGPGASADLGSPAAPGSQDVPPADAGPPADLAAPVDPASSARPGTLAAAGANTPPWAPIPSEPRALAKDVASAAIPDSAFPASAAPAAGAAAGSGAADPNLLGFRRAPTAAHRPAPARNVQVSGRPPWEPAPQPDSELPWAQAPAPPRGGTGSLPKREQTRPTLPSWDAVAEDVWPGGPRSAALHPPVPPPAGRNPGGLAARGSAADAPAAGARPANRPVPPRPHAPVPAADLVPPQPHAPVPAADLVPAQPDVPERARPAEERPGREWNLDDGIAFYSAARSEPTAADAPGGPEAGSGFSPASEPTDAPASTPAESETSTPADSTASTPADSAASEPAIPLPRRLSTPPLRPPSPSPPSQPGTGSSLFRGTGQPPFPPAPRPAAEPGAAGTWRPSAGPAPFPPASEPATDAPATDTAATGLGRPDAGKAQPGGPAVIGGGSGTVSAGGRAGAGSVVPQAARPGAKSSRPASGVPPWEITDSFPAVPSAPAETARADPQPEGKESGPLPGAGTAEPGDSTESFAAVDAGAEQRSFPRDHPGDGNENFPASRPRTDADAFRLFPPLRGTGNDPPGPPATDGQD